MTLSDTLLEAAVAARVAILEIRGHLGPTSPIDYSRHRRQAERITALLEEALAEMEPLQAFLDLPPNVARH